MNYWLLKSEPSTFSIDDLIARPSQTEGWDGVRNYQARNMMRDQMKFGDCAFFYHSNCDAPGIVGIVKIISAAYPDKTALDPQSKYYDPKSTIENPRWYQVDVKFFEKFPHTITLQQLRQVPKLQDMMILRKGNRLSITPVSTQEWQVILAL